MVDLVNQKQLEEVARQWLQLAEDAEVLDKIDSFRATSHSR
jgi:hypothetical protein